MPKPSRPQADVSTIEEVNAFTSSAVQIYRADDQRRKIVGGVLLAGGYAGSLADVGAVASFKAALQHVPTMFWLAEILALPITLLCLWLLLRPGAGDRTPSLSSVSQVPEAIQSVNDWLDIQDATMRFQAGLLNFAGSLVLLLWAASLAGSLGFL